MNRMHRLETALAMLSCVVLMQSVNAQTIQLVNPTDPSPGDLVIIAGNGFADRPGPVVVSLVKKATVNFPVSGPSCRMPIVHWSPNRILVIAPDCAPDVYSLAIRDADSNDWVVGRKSTNDVPLTLRPGAPPAIGMVDGKPQLHRVHPVVALQGGVLDVYGDFPFPDPSIDRIAVMRSLEGAAARVPPQVVATLEPIEIAREHLRVRLSENLEPGEHFVVFVKNPVDRSPPRRMVIRSLPAAPWESESSLPDSRVVPFKLVAAVRQVGVERRQIDLLGLGFGSRQDTTRVHWLAAADIENIQFNLRHKDDPGAPIHPDVVSPLSVVSWSDTRIRLEHSGGSFPSGTFFLLVSAPGYRWSNSVMVVVPPVVVPP